MNTDELKKSQDLREAKGLIEVAKINQERLRSLKELESNPHFKSLILNGYLHEEPLRIVRAMGQPQAGDEKYKAHLIKELDGIASFQNMLEIIYSVGENAPDIIRENEAVIAELMKEE